MLKIRTAFCYYDDTYLIISILYRNSPNRSVLEPSMCDNILPKLIILNSAKSIQKSAKTQQKKLLKKHRALKKKANTCSLTSTIDILYITYKLQRFFNIQSVRYALGNKIAHQITCNMFASLISTLIPQIRILTAMSNCYTVDF